MLSSRREKQGAYDSLTAGEITNNGRLQNQIHRERERERERMLREAEESVARRDWHMVKELAEGVIVKEPNNERAQHYLSLFEVRMLTPDPARTRTSPAEKQLANPLAKYKCHGST